MANLTAISRDHLTSSSCSVMPARGRRTRAAVVRIAVAAAACAMLPGCAGSGSNPTTPATAGVTVDTARSYASTSFVVPFDVTPPVWLTGKPHIEQPNFVTWEAPDLPAVRFLVPVTVYRPGETTPTGVPKDYLPYLLGQAKHGAYFRDQITSTVGGQPATLVTATTRTSLDGSLGCPISTTPAAECFGLQPELSLRIAVTSVQGKTLLVWLRMPTGAPLADATARRQAFEAMLKNIKFSSRDVANPSASSSSPASGPGTSSVDGSYVMTISWPKVKATDADARCVGGAEGSSALTVYELTLGHGSVRLAVRVGNPKAAPEPAFSGLFRLEKDQFIFGDGADPLTATFTVTNHTLTLSRLRGGFCGDRAIWTTKPWMRR
ncbi:MAG: hypothetical protein ABI662_09165 [Dermatophilaceae bacterium]